MQIKKAVRRKTRLRMALDGPPGSGKTRTALEVGKVLAEHANGRVGVIDTEHSSATLYADKFDFDSIELNGPENWGPEKYIEAIDDFAEAGYPIIIIDSFSHAWYGILDEHAKVTAKSASKNSYNAWREVTPQHNKLVDAVLSYPGHVIVTMRSKMAYEQTKDEKTGRNKVERLGMAPIQREGVEYEMDIVGDMDTDHKVIISKSRCDALADHMETKPGAKFAKRILDWLENGEAPEPRQVEPPKPDEREAITNKCIAGEKWLANKKWDAWDVNKRRDQSRTKYAGNADLSQCPVDGEQSLSTYLGHLKEKVEEYNNTKQQEAPSA